MPAIDFAEWVGVRRGALLRTAYLLTGDAHAAEDLVQEALERVALKWRRIVAGGAPEPYVRRVLYRQSVSIWRRHRGRERAVADLPDATVADHSGAADLRVTLEVALRRLTPKQRAVLVLRFYEDLSEAQTAQALGVGVGTVKSQTRHALGRLRILAPELSALIDGCADHGPSGRTSGAGEEVLR